MKRTLRQLMDFLFFMILLLTILMTTGLTGDPAGFATGLAKACLGASIGVTCAYGAAQAVRNGITYPFAQLSLLANIAQRRWAIAFRFPVRGDDYSVTANGDLLTLALEARDEGRTETAQDRLERLLAKEFSMTNAWVNLARIKLAENEPRIALAAIDMALLMDRPPSVFNKQGQIFVQKAEILERLGEQKKAIDLLEVTVIHRFPHYRKATQLHESLRQQIMR